MVTHFISMLKRESLNHISQLRPSPSSNIPKRSIHSPRNSIERRGGTMRFALDVAQKHRFLVHLNVFGVSNGMFQYQLFSLSHSTLFDFPPHHGHQSKPNAEPTGFFGPRIPPVQQTPKTAHLNTSPHLNKIVHEGQPLSSAATDTLDRTHFDGGWSIVGLLCSRPSTVVNAQSVNTRVLASSSI